MAGGGTRAVSSPEGPWVQVTCLGETPEMDESCPMVDGAGCWEKGEYGHWSLHH